MFVTGSAAITRIQSSAFHNGVYANECFADDSRRSSCDAVALSAKG
jgi:hypothetical protein